jgi:hypothetical protein
MKKYRRNDGVRGRNGEREISENLRDLREIKKIVPLISLINAD